MPFANIGSVRIHYDEAGSGDPVLLIQGTGLTGIAWEPQIEALKSTYRVIWFDNRGVGRSSYSAGTFSIDDLATDALGLLYHLNTGPVHVVGHSLGGIIARRLARMTPELVRSLSLLCTLPTGREAVFPRLDGLRAKLATMIGSQQSRRQAFARLVSSPFRIEMHGLDAITEQLTKTFHRQLEDQPDVVPRQIMAMAKDDGRPNLPEVRDIPTLIVSGADDLIAPPIFGEKLHRAIPGSRLEILHREGHAVTIQNAQRINELLLQHLAGAALA
ncbi:MAG TPA: alpha/beta hydrolase [Polyangium sp.]|nr:alpha/beta hydrolase [Polyangium sp.]